MVERKFTATRAVRSSVPLFVGLLGPSGGGKTKSALRLATGIQKVTGGRIKFIDTENGRALHYADEHDYDHIPFEPPYGSLDYAAAIQQAAAMGPGPIIVDSMSHEHEGQGGYIDLHSQEVQRLLPTFKTEMKAQVPAWNRPAQNRQQLISALVRLRANIIFCFRAKEKVKLRKANEPGEKVVDLGWMPIAGDAFLFEMTACALLLPGAKGVPTWQSEYPGEKMMIKDPSQFSWLYKDESPLSEATGERMARWASGSGTTASSTDDSFKSRVVAMAVRLKALGDSGRYDNLKTASMMLTWISTQVGRKIDKLSEISVEELAKLESFIGEME